MCIIDEKDAFFEQIAGADHAKAAFYAADRPAVLEVDEAGIADELKRLDRWVIWTLALDKNGRKTKVPLQCRMAHEEYRQEHGLRFYRASSTDPTTWTDFTTAMQFYRQQGPHGDVLGIGIMLGDGLAGVDPDNCLNSDGTLKDWARPIVDRLDTGFEVSPSGTGLKGLAFGSLDAVRRRPEYARRKNKKGEVVIPTQNPAGDGEVELYDHGRFFCITGHRFGTVASVNDRSEQLVGIFDDFIAEKPGRTPSEPAQDEPVRPAQMRAEEQAGEATAWPKQSRGDLTTLDVEGLWRAAGLWIEPDGDEKFRLQCPNRMAHSDPDDRDGTVCFKREGEYPRFVCKRTACQEAGYGTKDALLALCPGLVDSFCAEMYGGDDKPKREKSPGGQLVKMAQSACELIRSDDGTAYARVASDGHRETMALEGPAFKSWLCGMYYDETGRTARSEAVREALQVLLHKAARMPKQTVHLRIANTGDIIYWDLGDDSWRAVEVTRDGWRIVADPPVVFRRTPNTGALPEPRSVGSLDDMRPFVNLTDADWLLYKGAILVAAHGAGPFFVVTVHGEQGSAKSWACRFPKRLLDPVGAAELRTGLPGDDKAWIARLQGHYVLGFDIPRAGRPDTFPRVQNRVTLTEYRRGSPDYDVAPGGTPWPGFACA